MTDWKSLFERLARNAIEFSMNEDEEIFVGTSKIGGIPDLPYDFEWPYYAGESLDDGITAERPLSFVAQFDLEALAPYDRDNMLPHSGFLFFFYDMVSQKWGFDPDDAGCARVYWFDTTADKLYPTEYPDDMDEDFIVPECALSFSSAKSLPLYEEYSEVNGDEIGWEAYDLHLARTGVEQDRNPDEVFKLLGYADLIQNAMNAQCEMVTQGIYCGDVPEISAEQQKQIDAHMGDWLLLAQFGTICDELMFGDAGCIYFWIRRRDLAARRFDRIHLILQCG